MPSARSRENMLDGLFEVLDQHVFGDFQLEALRIEPAHLDDVAHLIDEMAVDLHRRDVDRDAHVIGPLLGGLDRLAHDHVGERRDQAVFLGQLDELRRRDRAELGMEPAGERLEADDTHIARADQRLEVRLYLTVLDCAAQLLAQHHAALTRLTKLIGEMPAASASFGLCVIEREIGVLDQVLALAGVVGKHRDADGGAGGQRFLADLDRAVEQAAKLLSDQARLERVVDLAQHHEFVAAEPRDEGVGRHLEFQLVGDGPQDLVADDVTMNVVDVLEVIEIDPEHRERCSVCARAVDGLGEPRAHQLAIGQRGEGIVVRQERHALLRVLAFADVAEFEQPCDAFAVGDAARRNLDCDRFAGAVGDFGVEPQGGVAEQTVDHVGIADEGRDHQVRCIAAFDADEPAQARIHRDRLHAGADRDAFIEHVEQRRETLRFPRRLPRSPQHRGQAHETGDEEQEAERASPDDQGQRSGAGSA